MARVTRRNFIAAASVAMLWAGASGQAGAQPAIRALVTPAPNTRGWNNTPVTVTFLCENSSSCPAPISLIDDGAGQRVARAVADAQGAHAEAMAVVNIDTAPATLSLVSPSAAYTVTSEATITIAALARDEGAGLASATCNGEPAQVSGVNISCSRTLREGINDIIVTAIDGAGNNTAASLRVWRQVETRDLRISPQRVTLERGRQRILQVLDDSGRTIADATLTSADPGVVQVIEGNDRTTPGTVVGVGAGVTTVTALWHERSATVAITVLDADKAAIGTPLWQLSPSPGFTVDQQVRTTEVGDGPYMLLVEAADGGGLYRVKAISKEPRQLWWEWPAIAPHERIIRWMGDQEGGGLLLLRGRGGDPAAIVQIGGIGAVGQAPRGLWRYESTGRLADDWAMDWDGTLYIVETPRDGLPQILAIDSTTGRTRFRLPVPYAQCAPPRSRAGDLALQVGPATVPDGQSAAFAYACRAQPRAAGGTPAMSQYLISLLRVDGAEHATVRPLREVRAPASAGAAAAGGAPRFTFHLVVPDGHQGLLVPVRTTMPDGTVDNRIIRIEAGEQTEYTLPTLGEYVLGEPFDGVTGSGYIADGHTLVAFDPVTGSVRWIYTPPAGKIHINFSVKGGGVLVDTDQGGVLLDPIGTPTVVMPPAMRGSKPMH